MLLLASFVHNYIIGLVKMMEIWNQVFLERPPCTTWQIKPLEAKKTDVDITRFKKTLSATIHDLESMDDLHRNAMILNRLIYRMKSKFRHDKGFTYMVRLGKALTNSYKMYLKNEYVTLKSYIQMEDGMFTLPSRQSLEYVLARTQGFGKLMTRIEQVSKNASHCFIARIKLGHAWSVALMALATVCRIWFHAKNIILKCCVWYDELYQCTQQFKYVGTKPWLPNDQNLPHNLKSWLYQEDWQDTDLHNHNLQTWQRLIGEVSSGAYNNITNEEIDSSFPNEETDSRLIQIASNNNTLEDKSTSNNDIDDLGEVIDREIFASSLPSNAKTTAIKRKHMDIDQRKSLKKSRIRRK